MMYWSELSKDARTVLTALWRAEQYGATDVWMDLASDSESVRAAISVLLLENYIEARQVPNGPAVYALTVTGRGLALLRVPEPGTSAEEAKRVDKAFQKAIRGPR